MRDACLFNGSAGPFSIMSGIQIIKAGFKQGFRERIKKPVDLLKFHLFSSQFDENSITHFSQSVGFLFKGVYKSVTLLCNSRE